MEPAHTVAPPPAGDAAELRGRIIRAYYGRLPNRELARRLGLTPRQLTGYALGFGLYAPVAWTARELALLREHYDSSDAASLDALVAVLGKPRHQIRKKARDEGLAATKAPPWTDAETRLLEELWGRYPDATVAKRLGRTVVACEQHMRRVVGRCRTDGIDGWTARGVARLMGVDSHKVTKQWVARGWLRATHAPFTIGKHRVRVVAEPALLRFFRDYPAEYRWERMRDPSGYYVRLAREAQGDLLTTAQVAARYGAAVSAVHRWIAKGWVPALRGHTSGKTGVWYVRERDLADWAPPGPGGARTRGGAKAVPA